MVDSDRGVGGVARRVRYVSWNDSSDCDGGGVGAVGDCDGGNGEGGGEDTDGRGACFGVDGRSGGAFWTINAAGCTGNAELTSRTIFAHIRL